MIGISWENNKEAWWHGLGIWLKKKKKLRNEGDQLISILAGYCLDLGFCSERDGEPLEDVEQRGTYS